MKNNQVNTTTTKSIIKNNQVHKNNKSNNLNHKACHSLGHFPEMHKTCPGGCNKVKNLNKIESSVFQNSSLIFFFNPQFCWLFKKEI
jgi:hypothetical protein